MPRWDLFLHLPMPFDLYWNPLPYRKLLHLSECGGIRHLPTYPNTCFSFLQDIDECSLRPQVCKNGATCTNTIGGYNCICVNGWTGHDCSENIDDCAGAACLNGATCHDRVGSFYCQCPPGKTGLLCHLNDACTSNPCHEGAMCETSPIDGSYLCSCPPGFKGTNCTIDIDECAEGEERERALDLGLGQGRS